MKQILQSLKTGSIEVAEMPSPRAGTGQVLIQTCMTLVSAGTERMLVEFGKANLIDKARQQPDKVRQVLDKVRTDGLLTTLETVRSKLDQPIGLGYCNVGIITEMGQGVDGFAVGERVVSNGKHAEVVCVPRNLCARIPDQVSDEHAAFTVLAAIGLQGVRLANPTLGECVVVTGLGLIGLLTVQLLRAQGCRVLGIDLNPTRLAMARKFGADTVNVLSGEDPVAAALAFSRGRGVDAVLITASTSSSEPVREAAHMCRKRGRIVLVGVTGLELSRADFYEKELSFQVSCSYGPGRYDPLYEERGQDYPVGYVRWTEQRNFEAVLDLMAAGRLDVAPLISHRFAFDQAESAYALLGSPAPSLGVLLAYPDRSSAAETLVSKTVRLRPVISEPGRVSVGFVGAGNYAGRVLMPAFQAAGAALHTVVTTGGVNGLHYGRKFGFVQVSTDLEALLADRTVDTVVIATRHDSHAGLVLQALLSGKHVFVEKPLCLTLQDVAKIEAASIARPSQRLMIGFNRRFAPQVVKMKQLLDTVAEPKSFIMTVNAGAIPPAHWTQDKELGGGRIVGEGCHFVDLLRYLAGSPIVAHSAVALGRHPALLVTGDKAVLTLQFADGSVGTIHYLANGHKGFPKEQLEVFCGGRILQLDNFRKLKGWGWKGFSTMNLWQQDKGVHACVRAFTDAIRKGDGLPVDLSELIEVSRVSIELQGALG
jgi:predicted dehydrogenase/threonine dehydrogenase-like Zn-dependent dehydrogenase